MAETDKIKEKIAAMVAAKLLELSQQNLVEMKAIDTGLLLRSGRIGKDFDQYYVLYDAPYAWPINFGAAPHYVNPKQLEGWVRRKLNIKNKKQANATAIAISKKILLHGTEPRPYMDKALEDIKKVKFDI